MRNVPFFRLSHCAKAVDPWKERGSRFTYLEVDGKTRCMRERPVLQGISSLKEVELTPLST